MRVLHILNGTAGGAANSTRSLIESLERSGVSSAIYVTDRGDVGDRDALAKSVDGRLAAGPLSIWTRRLRRSLPRRALAASALAVRTVASMRSVDRITAFALHVDATLIHSSTAVSPDGALAAARLGLGHVWHVRELIGPGYPHRIRGDTARLGEYLAASGSVITNSHTTAAVLGLPTEARNVFVIPNGLDLSHLATLEPTAAGRSRRYGMVANFTAAWKNHELFIRAAARSTEVYPNMRFALIGRKPLRSSQAYSYFSRLRQLAVDLGLHHNLAWIYDATSATEAMRHLDVLVHTASGESFGRVYIEALAAGRPVIAVDGGAAREVVGGLPGTLLTGETEQAVTRALVQDTLEREMVVPSDVRELVINRHNLEAYCAQVVDVYKTATAMDDSFLRSYLRVLRRR